ncbi:MAG: hypothetical protein ACE5J7_00055 [Candidatus Aenigmatarchaeota archaeon]
MAEYDIDSEREKFKKEIEEGRKKMRKDIEEARTGRNYKYDEGEEKFEEAQDEYVTITVNDKPSQEPEEERYEEKAKLINEMEGELEHISSLAAIESKDLPFKVYVQTMMRVMKETLSQDEYADELLNLAELAALDKEDRYELVDFEEFKSLRKQGFYNSK